MKTKKKKKKDLKISCYRLKTEAQKEAVGMSDSDWPWHDPAYNPNISEGGGGGVGE